MTQFRFKSGSLFKKYFFHEQGGFKNSKKKKKKGEGFSFYETILHSYMGLDVLTGLSTYKKLMKTKPKKTLRLCESKFICLATCWSLSKTLLQVCSHPADHRYCEFRLRGEVRSMIFRESGYLLETWCQEISVPTWIADFWLGILQANMP